MSEPLNVARPYRTWWVFYIDPDEPQFSPWKQAGSIGGRFTADEAIAQTVGRRLDKPFWAFALDKGQFGSYYGLHYPEGAESPHERRIGPAGYEAVTE